MVKGIFDTKADSGYDDDILRRYQFPAFYLPIAEAMLGDWIIYREPQRNKGRRAYVAVARVAEIVADTSRSGHYVARMSDFLPFDRPVAFAGSEGYWEQALREIPNRGEVGRYLQRKSVRVLSEADFAHIVRMGLTETLAPENAIRLELDARHNDVETAQLLAAPPLEQERRIQKILLNKKIRDANFRRQVCEAYDDRCAVTRLRMINGGGKSEVQAAHVVPVSDMGPDVIQNGIALSGTIHWLFDRHLISLTNDYRLLVSHNKIPSELRSLFGGQMEQIHLPKNPAEWPHPAYIERHRSLFSG